MAEKALQKVENELNCTICLDIYTNPKVLQCLHIYCQECLVRMAVRKQGQAILNCPQCRQVTPVPADGVASLPTDFRINSLLGIVEEHKKCKQFCSEHPDEELKMYCEPCGKQICLKCASITRQASSS